VHILALLVFIGSYKLRIIGHPLYDGASSPLMVVPNMLFSLSSRVSLNFKILNLALNRLSCSRVNMAIMVLKYPLFEGIWIRFPRLIHVIVAIMDRWVVDIGVITSFVAFHLILLLWLGYLGSLDGLGLEFRRTQHSSSFRIISTKRN
jgi:hypothetical protein